MNADTQKIDLVIQYALLVAGEEDNFYDQQLGPIHLIKYVYLADLYFSSRNNGETFTGVEWQFYNFGPWSQVVHSRIDPALETIMANKQTFESEYGDSDWERWNIRNDQLLAEKRDALPASITLKLQNNIHKYLKDTPSLLDFVYKTKPMLDAAPGELLDFYQTSETDNSTGKLQELKIDRLSKKKLKQFKQKMTELRGEFQKRKSSHIKLIAPVESPRMDEIYFEGLQKLEESDTDNFSEKTIRTCFSDEVWKSKTRKGNDVS